LDAETGLYYYRARYYDGTVGRFLQEDPIGIAGGPNAYIYASNDPINQFDPFGLDAIDVVANAAAGFGDAISFGITEFVREKMQINDVVDRCSWGYRAAWWIGFIHSNALGASSLFNGGSRTILWSGKGARQLAEAAKGNGKLLSDTLGGKFLNIVDDYVKVPQPVWKAASSVFAANAKGEVRVFLMNGAEEGVFNTVERPVLNLMNRFNSFVTGSPASKLIQHGF